MKCRHPNCGIELSPLKNTRLKSNDLCIKHWIEEEEAAAKLPPRLATDLYNARDTEVVMPSSPPNSNASGDMARSNPKPRTHFSGTITLPFEFTAKSPVTIEQASALVWDALSYMYPVHSAEHGCTVFDDAEAKVNIT